MKPRREIGRQPAVAEPLTVGCLDDVKAWLECHAKEHGLQWLLAHVDDGVVWGRVEEGALHVSGEVAPEVSPPLRETTLQQARLFGCQAELLLWRDGDNQWHARLLRDAEDGEPTEWDESFDEPQRLWGTHGAPLNNDFTLFRDGAQGLRHALPFPLCAGDAEQPLAPPRLVVRHYLSKASFARVVASRLIGFDPEPEVRK